MVYARVSLKVLRSMHEYHGTMGYARVSLGVVAILRIMHERAMLRTMAPSEANGTLQTKHEFVGHHFWHVAGTLSAHSGLCTPEQSSSRAVAIETARETLAESVLRPASVFPPSRCLLSLSLSLSRRSLAPLPLLGDLSVPAQAR